MRLNSKKVVFLLLLMLGASLWPCSIYALTSEQEREAADLISKGDYYLLRTFKADGIGMADEYRTPIIMDSLLELLKHPERAGEDDEFITWREIYAIATDSKDSRMVPDLAAHKGVGPKEISLFVKRMPKEAYEYSVDPKHFQPVVLKELLSHPRLLTASQRQQIRDTTLKRLENNTSNEVPELLIILGTFAKENDKESITVLKKYAESAAGTPLINASVDSIGEAAEGSDELADYFKKLYETTTSVGVKRRAIRNMSLVAVYRKRPGLLNVVKEAAKATNDSGVSGDAIKGLYEAVIKTQSVEAEDLLRKLAAEGIDRAKLRVKLLDLTRNN